MARLGIPYKKEVKEFCELAKENPVVCFDIETTGLSSQTAKILSFSAIKYAYENDAFKEIDRINLFINPEMHIPEEVTNINHITDEMVKDCPKEAEAAKIIKNFFGNNPLVCGYNSISFDEKFINVMYVRQFDESFTYLYHLDVMKMVKDKNVKDRLDLPNNKLETVALAITNIPNLEFHNSIDDVIATFGVFEKLLDEYTNEVEPVSTGKKVIVTDAKLWHRSHTLNRIYINNEENISIFYDIYKSEWTSKEDIDLEDVKTQVFNLFNVTNEKDLIKAVA